MKSFFTFILSIIIFSSFSQEKKLDEVTIQSRRIQIPFSKESKTIEVITIEEIKKSTSKTLTNLLQSIAGVDIRQRGANDTQSDIYIRGGGFDQVLILVDGFKMSDTQTGHHSANAIIPLESIEQIEVVKGASSRIYGQNAFSGAINIITKKTSENTHKIKIKSGSFGQLGLNILSNQQINDNSLLLNITKNKSDGYRENTDFDNSSILAKYSTDNYDIIANINNRKFGANGFYASPKFTDQYEETQMSLIGVSTHLNYKNLIIKPKIYWRRNQDLFLLKRNNPAFYRNLHITNNITAEANFSLHSKYGKTGFGIELAKNYISSNNLGKHNRFVTTSFLEHRFEILDKKLNITPGIAISNYSDFGTHAFPGIDVGYAISDRVKIYSNIGYTYRVPTFTDIFYSSPTTLGNQNLKPEKALSKEFGIKYLGQKLNLSAVYFDRKADNLIDYTKSNINEKWMAQNSAKTTTKGVELSSSYSFQILKKSQKLQINYTFIDDDIDETVAFSKYALNSLKHQVNASFSSEMFSFLESSFSYKYRERTGGDSYNLVDAKLGVNFDKWSSYLYLNNIFDIEYSHTNLVPMPSRNFMIELSYKF